MYHQICEPNPKGTPYRGLAVHPRDFRRQMLWLRRFGYRGLSMQQLMPYVRGEKSGKVFGLTFDDGYRNVLENALPILEETGFSASNYFVVRQLGGGNVWDAPEGVPHSDLMTVDEMRAWVAAGHEAGSHTLNHPFLPKLSHELAVNEIRDSKAELEQLLGIPVQAFCYPYGAQSMALRRIVAEAGYTNATTTERGLVRPGEDVYGLPRFGVMRSTNILRFLQKCMTDLEDRRRTRAERTRVQDALTP
ncbi:polysaccharide deacetylase family protein [Alcaligenaceae bacterium CGII-47]|nr:polysaccharide deacetylase family protein [Alcaligenaceae bacterium CGII-47]